MMTRPLLATVGSAFLLTASLCLTQETAATSPAPMSHPEVFALVRTKFFDRVPEIAALPGLTGVTLYTSLQKLEPEEGQYDWSSLDSAVNAAAKAGKKIHLAVLGGRWVPEWLYAKGAKRIDWTHTTNLVDAGSSPASAPEPWDPVYLAAMTNIAREMGKRYGSNPAVTGVQITGPALANGLETNFVLSPEDAEKAGYSPDKYIAAWLTMGRAFHEAFPNQQICLALSNQFAGKRDERIPRQIRDQLSAELGDKLVLMVFYLTHESWFSEGNPAIEIWREKQDIKKGAQTIVIYGERKWEPELLRATVEKAGALGAGFVEIWIEDLFVPSYLDAALGRSASK